MRLVSASGGISRRTLLKAGSAAAGLSALGGLARPALAASGAATITFAYFGDPTQATSMRQSLLPLVKKVDQNADLKVVGYNGTDWNDFFAKILTQIAAGAPPDIVGVATEGVQLMAAKNLAIPMDDYVKRDMAELKEMFADVDPILIEGLMYDGHLFELPVNFNAGNMFYSTKLFQQAGLERPADNWSMDDFHSYAKKIAAVPNVNAFDWVVRLWGELDLVHVRQWRQSAGGTAVRWRFMALGRRLCRQSGREGAQGGLEMGRSHRQFGGDGRSAAIHDRSQEGGARAVS
jgi:ABC-type glycerol-3-phosphate transport system substrate-binding protein